VKTTDPLGLLRFGQALFEYIVTYNFKVGRIAIFNQT